MSEEKDVSIYSGGRGGGKTEAQIRQIGIIGGMSSAEVRSILSTGRFRLVGSTDELEERSKPSQYITVGNQDNQENNIMSETDRTALESITKAIIQQTVLVDGIKAMITHGYGPYVGGSLREYSELLAREEGTRRHLTHAACNIRERNRLKAPLVAIPPSELHPEFYEDLDPQPPTEHAIEEIERLHDLTANYKTYRDNLRACSSYLGHEMSPGVWSLCANCGGIAQEHANQQ